MVEPDFVQGTLDWCNGKRLEQDLPKLNRLPKGKRGNTKSCPCGAATNLIVGMTRWFTDGEDKEGQLLPVDVRSFVIAFDTRELPQYDEEINVFS